MPEQEQRWRCNYCGKISAESALLTAPSPFDEAVPLTACPHCRQVVDEELELICDHLNCEALATNSWFEQLVDGKWLYRETCLAHSPPPEGLPT